MSENLEAQDTLARLQRAADAFLDAGRTLEHWDSAVVVVSVWRAENPDDDVQFISAEWLPTIGFTQAKDQSSQDVWVKRSLTGTLAVLASRGSVFWEGEYVRTCVTRGHLRKLIAAIGLDD